jgi:hypothetical protein
MEISATTEGTGTTEGRELFSLVRKETVMRWEVIGADSKTGREIVTTVEAASREEAEQTANYNGILVTSVTEVFPDGTRRPEPGRLKAPVVEYQAPARADPSANAAATGITNVLRKAEDIGSAGLALVGLGRGARRSYKSSDETSRAHRSLRFWAGATFNLGLLALVAAPVLIASTFPIRFADAEAVWRLDAGFGALRFALWAFVASALLRGVAALVNQKSEGT